MNKKIHFEVTHKTQALLLMLAANSEICERNCLASYHVVLSDMMLNRQQQFSAN